jgi:hypothetical protein
MLQRKRMMVKRSAMMNSMRERKESYPAILQREGMYLMVMTGTELSVNVRNKEAEVVRIVHDVFL